MLTDAQNNQLRYELKRRFMLNAEDALDKAIDQVIDKGVELGSVVTIQLTLQNKILKKTKEGFIQFEQVKEV